MHKFYDASVRAQQSLSTLSDMNSRDLSELMVEADFLWREISVGDLIQIEESIWEGSFEVLTPGREYMVLAKMQSATGLCSFVTESNLQDQTAVVYPYSICNYVVLPGQWIC